MPTDREYQEWALMVGGTFVKREKSVNSVHHIIKMIYMGNQ